MPSNATILLAFDALFWRRMDKTSAAYCLLLSKPSLRMRLNNQSSTEVDSPICAASGGMNERRFSKTPRV